MDVDTGTINIIALRININRVGDIQPTFNIQPTIRSQIQLGIIAINIDITPDNHIIRKF